MKNVNKKYSGISQNLTKILSNVEIILNKNAENIFYVKNVICYFYFTYYITHSPIDDDSLRVLEKYKRKTFLIYNERLKLISDVILYILKNDIFCYNKVILNREFIILENYQNENYVIENYLNSVRKGKKEIFLDFLKIKIKNEELLPFMVLLCCSDYKYLENMCIFMIITLYVIYTFLEKYNVKTKLLKEEMNIFQVDKLYLYISDRYKMDGYFMCTNKVINIVLSFYINLLNIGKNEILNIINGKVVFENINKNKVKYKNSIILSRLIESSIDKNIMYEKLQFLFITICNGLLLILENLVCVNYLTFVILDIFILISKYYPSFIKKNIEKFISIFCKFVLNSQLFFFFINKLQGIFKNEKLLTFEVYSKTINYILEKLDKNYDNVQELFLLLFFYIIYIKLFLVKLLKNNTHIINFLLLSLNYLNNYLCHLIKMWNFNFPIFFSFKKLINEYIEIYVLLINNFLNIDSSIFSEKKIIEGNSSLEYFINENIKQSLIYNKNIINHKMSINMLNLLEQIINKNVYLEKINNYNIEKKEKEKEKMEDICNNILKIEKTNHEKECINEYTKRNVDYKDSYNLKDEDKIDYFKNDYSDILKICKIILKDFSEIIIACVYKMKDKKKLIEIVISNFKKINNVNKHFLKFYFINIILPFKKFFNDDYIKNRLFYIYSFILRKLKIEEIKAYIFSEIIFLNYSIFNILNTIKYSPFLFYYLEYNKNKIDVTFFNDSIFKGDYNAYFRKFYRNNLDYFFLIVNSCKKEYYLLPIIIYNIYIFYEITINISEYFQYDKAYLNNFLYYYNCNNLIKLFLLFLKILRIIYNEKNSFLKLEDNLRNDQIIFYFLKKFFNLKDFNSFFINFFVDLYLFYKSYKSLFFVHIFFQNFDRSLYFSFLKQFFKFPFFLFQEEKYLKEKNNNDIYDIHCNFISTIQKNSSYVVKCKDFNNFVEYQEQNVNKKISQYIENNENRKKKKKSMYGKMNNSDIENYKNIDKSNETNENSCIISFDNCKIYPEEKNKKYINVNKQNVRNYFLINIINNIFDELSSFILQDNFYEIIKDNNEKIYIEKNYKKNKIHIFILTLLKTDILNRNFKRIKKYNLNVNDFFFYFILEKNSYIFNCLLSKSSIHAYKVSKFYKDCLSYFKINIEDILKKRYSGEHLFMENRNVRKKDLFNELKLFIKEFNNLNLFKNYKKLKKSYNIYRNEKYHEERNDISHDETKLKWVIEYIIKQKETKKESNLINKNHIVNYDVYNINLLFVGYCLILNCLKYKSKNKKESFLMLANMFDMFLSKLKNPNNLKENACLLKNAQHLIDLIYIMDAYQLKITNKLITIINDRNNFYSNSNISVFLHNKLETYKKNYLDKYFSTNLYTFYLNHVNIYNCWKKLTIFKNIISNDNFLYFNTSYIFSIFDQILNDLIENLTNQISQREVNLNTVVNYENTKECNDDLYKIIDNFIHIIYINNILTFISVYSKESFYIYSLFDFYIKMKSFLKEIFKENYKSYDHNNRGNILMHNFNKESKSDKNKKYSNNSTEDSNIKLQSKRDDKINIKNNNIDNNSYFNKNDSNINEHICYTLISHFPFCLININEIINLYIDFINNNFFNIVNYLENNKKVLTLISSCQFFKNNESNNNNNNNDEISKYYGNLILCNTYFFKSIIYIYMQSCIYLNNPQHIYNFLKNITSINKNILSMNIIKYLLGIFFLKNKDFYFCRMFIENALYDLEEKNNERNFIYDLNSYDDLINLYFMNVSFCDNKRKLRNLCDNLNKTIFLHTNHVDNKNDFLNLIINYYDYNLSMMHNSKYDINDSSFYNFEDVKKKEQVLQSYENFHKNNNIDSDDINHSFNKNISNVKLKNNSIYNDILEKNALFVIKNINKNKLVHEYDEKSEKAKFLFYNFNKYLKKNSFYCYEFYIRKKLFTGYMNNENKINVLRKKNKFCYTNNINLYNTDYLKEDFMNNSIYKYFSYRNRKDILIFFLINNIFNFYKKKNNFFSIYLLIKNNYKYKKYIENNKLFFSIINNNHLNNFSIKYKLKNLEVSNKLLYHHIFVKERSFLNKPIFKYDNENECVLDNDIDINYSKMNENYLNFIFHVLNKRNYYENTNFREHIEYINNMKNENNTFLYNNYEDNIFKHLYNEYMNEEYLIINEIEKKKMNVHYSYWNNSFKNNLFLLKIYYELYVSKTKGKMQKKCNEYIDISYLVELKKIRKLIIKFSNCKQKFYDWNYIKSYLYDKKKDNSSYIDIILNHLLFLQYTKTLFLYNSINSMINSFDYSFNSNVNQKNSDGSIYLKNNFKIKNKLLFLFKNIFIFYHEKEILKKMLLSSIQTRNVEILSQEIYEIGLKNKSIPKICEKEGVKYIHNECHNNFIYDCNIIDKNDEKNVIKKNEIEDNFVINSATNYDLCIYDFIIKIPIYMYALIYRNILNYFFEKNEDLNLKRIIFFLFLHLYKKIPEIITIHLTAFYKMFIYDKYKKIFNENFFSLLYKKQNNLMNKNDYQERNIYNDKFHIANTLYEKSAISNEQEKIINEFENMEKHLTTCVHYNNSEKEDKFSDIHIDSNSKESEEKHNILHDYFITCNNVTVIQFFNKIKDSNFLFCLDFNDNITSLLNSFELIFSRIFQILLSYVKHLMNIYIKNMQFPSLKTEEMQHSLNSSQTEKDLSDDNETVKCELNNLWKNKFLFLLIFLNELVLYLNDECENNNIFLNYFFFHMHLMSEFSNITNINFYIKNLIEEELRKIYIVFIDFYCYLYIKKKIKLIKDIKVSIKKHILITQNIDIPEFNIKHFEELKQFLFNFNNFLYKIIENNKVLDLKNCFFSDFIEYKSSTKNSELINLFLEEKTCYDMIAYNKIINFRNEVYTIKINNPMKIITIIFQNGNINSYIIKYGEDLRINKYISDFFDFTFHLINKKKFYKNSLCDKFLYNNIFHSNKVLKNMIMREEEIFFDFSKCITVNSSDIIYLSNIIGLIKKNKNVISVLSLINDENKKNFNENYNEKFAKKIKKYEEEKMNQIKSSVYSEQKMVFENGKNEIEKIDKYVSIKNKKITKREKKKILKEVYEELKVEYEKQTYSIKLYIHMLSNNNKEYFNNRKKYTSSLIFNSCINFIAKVGDRHLNNILYDYINHEIFNIDLNLSFQKGLYLTNPEVVPIRITDIFWKATIFNFSNSTFIYNLNKISSIIYQYKNYYLNNFFQFFFYPFYYHKNRNFFQILQFNHSLKSNCSITNYVEKKCSLQNINDLLFFIYSMIKCFNSIYMNHSFIINNINKFKKIIPSHIHPMYYNNIKLKNKIGNLINNRLYYFHYRKIINSSNNYMNQIFCKIFYLINNYKYVKKKNTMEETQQNIFDKENERTKKETKNMIININHEIKCLYNYPYVLSNSINSNDKNYDENLNESNKDILYIDHKNNMKNLFKKVPLYHLNKLHKLLQLKEINKLYLLKIEKCIKKLFVIYNQNYLINKTINKKFHTAKDCIIECLKINKTNISNESLTEINNILYDNFLIIENIVNKNMKTHFIYIYFISYMFYIFSIDLKKIMKIYISHKRNSLKYFMKESFFFPQVKRSCLRKIIINTSKYLYNLKNNNIFYYLSIEDNKIKNDNNDLQKQTHKYSKNDDNTDINFLNTKEYEKIKNYLIIINENITNISKVYNMIKKKYTDILNSIIIYSTLFIFLYLKNIDLKMEEKEKIFYSHYRNFNLKYDFFYAYLFNSPLENNTYVYYVSFKILYILKYIQYFLQNNYYKYYLSILLCLEKNKKTKKCIYINNNNNRNNENIKVGIRQKIYNTFYELKKAKTKIDVKKKKKKCFRFTHKIIIKSNIRRYASSHYKNRNLLNYFNFLIYLLSRNNFKKNIMKQINNFYKYMIIFQNIKINNKKKINIVYAYNKIVEMYRFYDINIYYKKNIIDIYRDKNLYFYKPFYDSKMFLHDDNELDLSENSDDSITFNEQNKLLKFHKSIYYSNHKFKKIKELKNKKENRKNCVIQKTKMNIKPFEKFQRINKLHKEIDEEKLYYNELNMLYYMKHFESNNDVHFFNQKIYYNEKDCDILLSSKNLISSIYYAQNDLMKKSRKPANLHFLRKSNLFQQVFYVSKSPNYLSKIYQGWAPWL
ncbi:hypothetical protein PGAL8A_00312000 [Plasmodium gallinaceum]|uniref:PI3K/PI4K catalytic domain-containing protein n=1 Tax=Plasmodium gallinaceum TaxID=5849 RepID=A0A1J1GUI7_PLAGA|nr:hypothetical protein PGAL8A_00312000 [Plasmodium gallinaceum]CRG95907.1 hypothetical protein PGAL8A_00312000 [Plasmodium gallinaceum]